MVETQTQAADANARFLAQLDARLEQIGRRLDRLVETLAQAQGGEDTSSPRRQGAAPKTAGGHLLFLPGSCGYEILARQGPPPAPGEEVPLEGRGTFLAWKVAASPLPGDERPCVYLQLT
ncbi:MAG: hypothetical protein C4306_05325 [Thermoleophilia bacterium]